MGGARAHYVGTLKKVVIPQWAPWIYIHACATEKGTLILTGSFNLRYHEDLILLSQHETWLTVGMLRSISDLFPIKIIAMAKSALTLNITLSVHLLRRARQNFDLNQIKARISQITPLHRFSCPRESHATRLTCGTRLARLSHDW